MNILYFHGFASAGSSGTVNLLRNEFAPTGGEVKVVAPDIPVDPAEALPMLKKLAAEVNPVLIIGTSMGGISARWRPGSSRASPRRAARCAMPCSGTRTRLGCRIAPCSNRTIPA